jgi:hypothetical protein
MQISGSPSCRISTKAVEGFTGYMENSIYGLRQPRIYYWSVRLKNCIYPMIFMNAFHIKFKDRLWDGLYMEL